MYNIEDYKYELPERLIAQRPASNRDSSRLLLVDRGKNRFSDRKFSELPQILDPGDLLVLNNTKVVPAKLFGRKASGGRVEILVLEHHKEPSRSPDTGWCLLKTSKRPKKESKLFFNKGVTGTIEELGEDGLVKIRFSGYPLASLIEEDGIMPLPPYIKRSPGDQLRDLDRERYQTVFAKEKGAVAAPTAGLHFTEQLIKELEQKGVALVELTLHVGHGTFKPVRVRDIRNHRLGDEIYHIAYESAQEINRAKDEGRRVIGVGTTVVRALESAVDEDGRLRHGNGQTDLLITPGFHFRVIDGLITNFHLPGSSLLFLVAAFAGLDLMKRAYGWAIEEEYRFYSYGDAMLIL
ncbi:MAG: tRNA preQ1(34) S-adenosylmethionine ribosyltransferase-isomerase QueA [Deltaproteobacteria bacterium]|nr:tRNA preQ1(34) S-adenosylmethionine ribosyltransferase-isomerase QueA [Deltaproteobacteria bacterium]